MEFKVKLYGEKTPVVAGGRPVYLGHLMLMLHAAIAEGRDGFQEIIDLAEEVFVKTDGSVEADSALPAFDSSFQYMFSGVGAWGAGNVSGMLELLFSGQEFLQVGVQLKIAPILFFGTGRSFSNVFSDLSQAVESSYGQSLPSPLIMPNAAVSQVSDAASHCYLSLMDTTHPLITCRIGNRLLWDQG